MAADLGALAEQLKALGEQVARAIEAQQTVTVATPTVEAPTAPPEAAPATTVSVPADTAATLTVAPADTVQQVVQDTANLAESILAPALGGDTAVTALEKTVVGDVATGDTASAVATLATTAQTLKARSSLLETTAQAHTDQIAAIEQRISQLAKVSPTTLRFINLGLLIGAAVFFVAMQVAAASGNVWAAHNVQLALVILGIAAALISTPALVA